MKHWGGLITTTTEGPGGPIGSERGVGGEVVRQKKKQTTMFQIKHIIVQIAGGVRYEKSMTFFESPVEESRQGWGRGKAKTTLYVYCM